jgi:ABC-type ATPase with predicted acetyltransferase domain
MKFHIEKKIPQYKSYRNDFVKGQFDLSDKNFLESFSGEIDLEGKSWNVGVIVGNSGTGKTTIARKLFGDSILENYNFSPDKSVLDCMPSERKIKDITQIFNKVGFSSPPSWLKSYRVLSNGEKMRVELAYNLLSSRPVICFDEFTSVVDRDVAKVVSSCVQKTVRFYNKKFIAVTCHFDVIGFLEPDWVFDTNSMQFFFIKNQTDQQDQNLILKLLKPTENFGDCLQNITI